jgi:hypothetical protein
VGLLSGSNILLLCVSQGSISTDLCYASFIVWTSVDGKMCDRDSNSRPRGSDTMLDAPLTSPTINQDDIEGGKWTFYQISTDMFT